MAGKRQKKKLRKFHNVCVLCGQKIENTLGQRVIGQTGYAVCSACLQTAKIINTSSMSDIKESRLIKPYAEIIPPSKMVCELDKSIIGQNQAKRALAVAFWKQQMRTSGAKLPNNGLLLYGPTGCGKTALVREAARLSGLPCIVADATTLTETGYRGRDGKDIIIDLAERCGTERAKFGVVFLDEFDKLRISAGNEYRSAYQRGTQHSLLKLIEGIDLRIDGASFSTADILFIFGGAFTGLHEYLEKQDDIAIIGFERPQHKDNKKSRMPLPEDFVRYGMESELMGRISRCVALTPLTAEDMKRILLESDLSVYRKYQKFFRQYGRELSLDDSMISTLASQAQERGMGARGLNALVEEWIESQLFSLSEGM